MSEPMPSKAAVVEALRVELSAELEALERVAEATRDEVGSDETKQEGIYDTRATEASYLARGQAMRIAELRRLLAWADTFDPARALAPPVVQVGALVAIGGHRRELLFVTPSGGGSLQVGSFSVRVVSPGGPLGEAMAELEAGDEIEIDSPRGVLRYEVLEVR